MQLQRNSRSWRVAFLAALLFAGTAAAGPSNKWRIEVSGGADSDGSIAINLVPVEQPAVTVTVNVPKGTGENKVAQLIREAIHTQVGDKYKSEVDDGEDVLVKRGRGSPDFELSLATNTVDGVRLDFEKE